MKDEEKILLFHFGIYLEVEFGFVLWEAFTDLYSTSMDAFQYYPLKNCSIERTSVTGSSIIVSDDNFDCDFTKWELTNNLQEVPNEIEFDLTYQVSLHISADICGIFGSIKRDYGTTRSNLSDATFTSSK